MEYNVSHQGNDRRVVLQGHFTFTDNHKFKQIMQLMEQPDIRSITLDFAGVEFIDSAGLGMLLLLRDECQSRSLSISISSARGQVEKIFLLSRFDQLFTLV